MSVIRVEKNFNYTAMSNYHLRDASLSLKAKGLLSVCLSLPETWDYSVNGLASICKESRRAILTTLQELERCGYVRRNQTSTDFLCRFNIDTSCHKNHLKQNKKHRWRNRSLLSGGQRCFNMQSAW